MATDKELAVVFKVGDDEVKLSPAIVRDYLTGGVAVSMPEFKMFTELCKARKLNPFLREAYIIKYGNQPATIVVGKDAILKRAINHKDFNGREQGIIVINKNGDIENRKGTFKLKDEELVGGWARVYRKGWDYPTEITVSFNEVAQLKDEYIDNKKTGKKVLNSNWATKGATMVEKVALVRALRETFTEDLSGMIDRDEVWDNETMEHRETKQPINQQKDAFEDVEVEVIPKNQTEIDFNEI